MVKIFKSSVCLDKKLLRMNFVPMQFFEKYMMKMQNEVEDETKTSNETVICKREGRDQGLPA